MSDWGERMRQEGVEIEERLREEIRGEEQAKAVMAVERRWTKACEDRDEYRQDALRLFRELTATTEERDRARRYLTEALDIIATRIGPVGNDWYTAAKRAAGEEEPDVPV